MPAPGISRDPIKYDNRLRRFIDQVSTVLTSLMLSEEIQQSGPDEFTLNASSNSVLTNRFFNNRSTYGSMGV